MPDALLKTLLNEAKTKPRNFVLAVNGSDIALILSKKKVSSAQKNEAKAKAKGATKTFTGVVDASSGSFVFKSLDQIPRGAAEPLKKYVTKEGQVTITPVFEKVTTLVEIDEDDGRFDDVTGGKSAIDVNARQVTELNAQVQKMRDFVAESANKKIEFQRNLDDVAQKRKDCTAKKLTATKELRTAKTESPPDQGKIDAITKDVETLTKLSGALFDAWNEAREKVSELDRLTSDYTETLRQYDALAGDFPRQYALMQHGRQEAIDAVRAKLDKVYADTNRKLVILGRTADTFEGDSSWAAKHPKEGGRVLQEDDWSMAVNDAFINSGLDQKAEFAMISKFKDSVLAKIKELLRDPGGRTPAELKKELRAFAKQEGDKALFTGGRYNDGFAVSMIELEQLIDDGYVMMEHDTGAASVKDLKDLKPTPVMVPSGKGQKIKQELAEATAKRNERLEAEKKRINAAFVEILKSSTAKIKDSKPAMKQVQLLKAAMDENRWQDANNALEELRGALA